MGLLQNRADGACHSEEVAEWGPPAQSYLRLPSPLPGDAVWHSLGLNHTTALHGLQSTQELAPTFHL